MPSRPEKQSAYWDACLFLALIRNEAQYTTLWFSNGVRHYFFWKKGAVPIVGSN